MEKYICGITNMVTVLMGVLNNKDNINQNHSIFKMLGLPACIKKNQY